MSAQGFSEAINSRLADEAALPVHMAITRFAHAASPQIHPHFALSIHPPNLFVSLDTVETCYNVWIALPRPSSTQASNLRQQVASLPSPSPFISIEFAHASRVFRVPLMVVNLWARLQSLISVVHSWGDARKVLTVLSRSGGASKVFAQRMLCRLSTLSIDSTLPGLLYFRTSFLPDLMTDSWLSDDHINASNQVIAMHPQRAVSIGIMDTFFLVHLKNHFERHGDFSTRRPSAIDSRIVDGIITELLIPVYYGNHWTLLVINIPNKRFAYADTLDLEAHIPPPSCLEAVSCWLSWLFNSSTLTLTSMPLPFRLNQQTDGHSCGVAVIANIAHYAIGVVSGFLAWSQSSSTTHRVKWSFILSHGIQSQDIHEEISLLDDNPGAGSQDSLPNSTDSEYDMCDPTPPSSPTLSSHTTVHHIQPQSSKPTYRQLTLPFHSVSREEYNSTEKQRYLDRRAERENDQEQAELKKAKLKLKRKEYNRVRKQKQRKRQRTARAALKMEQALASDEESQSSDQDSSPSIDPRIRERLVNLTHARTRSSQGNSGLSRWKKARMRPSAATKRVNWCHPLVWPTIEQTARQVGFPWSPTEIVRRLWQIDPVLYATLRPQRISQWRDHTSTDELRWTESHSRAIETGDRTQATGAGRRGVFDQHPQVVQSIRSCLTGLRTAGVSLNLNLIRGYMVGVIQHYIPDTFTRTYRNNRRFQCSTQFVRRFLHSELGWTIRKGTRAAQKYPANVNTILLHAYLRFACVVRDEDIPACCIVNADQTQVVYNPGDHKTWNPSGDQQIQILGSDDKRAFTLMVAISNSGSVLPFQAIYAGRSPRSLPGSTTPQALEAAQLMFSLDVSGSNNYWSSFHTLCVWVARILAPYFLLQRAQHNLPENQRCILQIDCWAVHRSAQFREWMNNNYPWIILLYVPGGCTGLFQACDVGIQRILKLAIARAAHADIVIETASALQAGVAPSQIINDQTLPTLRNRSVGWIVKGYHAINRPEIVKKAFALCAVPGTEFNLSYESLTSRAARQAILDLRSTNPKLYAEITSGKDEIPINNANDVNQPAKPVPGDNEHEVEVNDLDHTVEEVTSVVLNAHTAAEAAQPLEDVSDLDSDIEENE